MEWVDKDTFEKRSGGSLTRNMVWELGSGEIWNWCCCCCWASWAWMLSKILRRRGLTRLTSHYYSKLLSESRGKQTRKDLVIFYFNIEIFFS